MKPAQRISSASPHQPYARCLRFASTAQCGLVPPAALAGLQGVSSQDRLCRLGARDLHCAYPVPPLRTRSPVAAPRTRLSLRLLPPGGPAPTMHCTTVSILRLSPSHLQQPVCSLNWLIFVVSHHLKQVKSILSGCVQSMTCLLYLYLIVATCVYQYG